MENILKYYNSKEIDNDNLNNGTVVNEDASPNTEESPYKNILKNVKKVDLDSSNEANDFKTPKHFNNKKKMPSKVRNTKVSLKQKKSTKKKLNLRNQPKIKSFTSARENLDTDQEHLDMAIALSRSLQSETSDEDTNATASKKTVMINLEQFVYKPSNGKYSVANHRPVIDRRKTKARSKYVTPTLMLRTQEEREEIIASKISELLASNAPPVQRNHESSPLKPLSEYLENYVCTNRSLFTKSYTSDTPLDGFYVRKLNLDQSLIRCGSLLKDWSKIPGRSLSPTSSLPVSTPTKVSDLSSIPKDNIQSINSPELFDSDDDNFYIATRKCFTFPNTKDSESSSESLLNLTPRKPTVPISKELSEKDYSHSTLSSGESHSDTKHDGYMPEIICEIEKCGINSETVSINSEKNKCYDLTQSSCSEDSARDGKVADLKSGLSDIFQDGMNVHDLDFFEDGEVLLNSNVNNFRNKSVDCLKDTFDELFQNEVNLSIFTDKIHKNNSSPTISNLSNRSFNSTQDSIVISDDEINYSCNYGKSDTSQKSSSSLESIGSEHDSKSESSPHSESLLTGNVNNEILEDTILYTLKDIPNSGDEKPNLVTNENENTPKSNVIIKTSNVTPSADYNEMDTPKIARELEKFGIKPLKRKHGIKLLNYIYDSTHPMLHHTDVNSTEGGVDKNIKRRKMSAKRSLSPFQYDNTENETDMVKNTYNVLGENEELIFEKVQSKRVASCRIPLHIVWYNLVASDPNLQKSILLYEPLQLELLYKTIKNHGYRFHIQDLLKFLDKKCITIRTEQQSRHKKKRSKKKSK